MQNASLEGAIPSSDQSSNDSQAIAVAPSSSIVTNEPAEPPTSISTETPFQMFSFFPQKLLPQALSIYGTIRSFSCVLRLSPIHPIVFARALLTARPTSIMDHVHTSMLRYVDLWCCAFCSVSELHLDSGTRLIHVDRYNENEWGDLTTKGYEQSDLCLCDTMTWPFYVRLAVGVHVAEAGAEGFGENTERLTQLASALRTQEPYRLPVCDKIAILQFLCDKVLDTESVRFEIAERQRRQEFRLRQLRQSLQHGEDPDDMEEQDNSDVCNVCSKGGQLICCDTCTSAYHMKCVRETRHTLPDGEWSCPECTIPDCNRALPQPRILVLHRKKMLTTMTGHTRNDAYVEAVSGCVYRCDHTSRSFVPLTYGELEQGLADVNTALAETCDFVNTFCGSSASYYDDEEALLTQDSHLALRMVLQRGLANSRKEKPPDKIESCSGGGNGDTANGMGMISEPPNLFFCREPVPSVSMEGNSNGDRAVRAVANLKRLSGALEKAQSKGWYLNKYNGAGSQERGMREALVQPLVRQSVIDRSSCAPWFSQIQFVLNILAYAPMRFHM